MLRRLRNDERGFALVMALGALTVLSFVIISAVEYTSSNSRASTLSKASVSAYALAEAGLNNALATIFNATTAGSSPYNKYLFCSAGASLPCSQSKTYDSGTATWTPVLDENASPYPTWTITAVGAVKNPTGVNGADVKKTVSAKVPVQPVYAQPLTNQAWDYIFIYGTGDPSGCDYYQNNNSTMGSPLFVQGNACFDNQAKVANGDVQIWGTVTFNNSQNMIGTSSTPITTGVHIAGGCKLKPSTTFHKPCTSADQVYANPAADTTPVSLAHPVPDWTYWYKNASPGPYYACKTSSGSPPNTGNWATAFDNDQGSATAPDASKLNRSVAPGGTFNLTPSTSYSCKTSTGELSWNSTTKVLTLNGTVFVDGNARIDVGGTISYNGVGVLYLAGSFVIKNTNVCAVISGNTCDWVVGSGHWDTSQRFFMVVAGGVGGGGQSDVPASDICFELISSGFQGGIESAQRIDVSTTSTTQGPLVTSKMTVGQTLNTYWFPQFASVPTATPGNPVLAGNPLSPTNYTGT